MVVEGWWWLLQTDTEARLSFHAGIMLHDLQLPGKNSLEIPYISETNYPRAFSTYEALLAKVCCRSTLMRPMAVFCLFE